MELLKYEIHEKILGMMNKSQVVGGVCDFYIKGIFWELFLLLSGYEVLCQENWMFCLN